MAKLRSSQLTGKEPPVIAARTALADYLDYKREVAHTVSAAELMPELDPLASVKGSGRAFLASPESAIAAYPGVDPTPLSDEELEKAGDIGRLLKGKSPKVQAEVLELVNARFAHRPSTKEMRREATEYARELIRERLEQEAGEIADRISELRARRVNLSIPESMLGVGSDEWGELVRGLSDEAGSEMGNEMAIRLAQILNGVPPEQRAEALERAQELLTQHQARSAELERVCVDVLAAIEDALVEVSEEQGGGTGADAMRAALNDPALARTVLAFDYGGQGVISYKTMLERGLLIETLMRLTARWRNGEPPELTGYERENARKLPPPELMEVLGKALKKMAPEGVGLAFIMGVGAATYYVGTAEREGVAETIEKLCQDLDRTLAAKVTVSEAEMVEACRRMVRDWHCPPGPIRNASMVEVLAMNAAHASDLVGMTSDKSKDELGIRALALSRISQRDGRVASIVRNLNQLAAMVAGAATGDRAEDNRTLELAEKEIDRFLEAWRRSSYARLEVGHRLAAALCLTDVPSDVDVKAPWEAWSLVIPDGLLPPLPAHDGTLPALARVWCIGTDPVFLVAADGRLTSRFEDLDTRKAAAASPAFAAMLNLIRGACLALSNPEDFRKERQHKPSARSAKKQRSGPPDLAQARFLLSAPVKVDLREHLASALSGRRGGARPKVQFLVRGHWKNQPYGPRHSLRKTIWIEPFWKGPEESRILLRQHKVEE